MHKLSVLAAVSAAFGIGILFVSHTAKADSLSCASANGVTRCTGSDGLDCQTVDGRMVCTPGSKGSCETVGEMTICRNGSVTQSLRTGPRSPGKPDGGDQEKLQRQSGTRPGDPSEEWRPIQPDQEALRLSMERLGQKLRALGLEKN